jgi:hypothetical protein
MASASTDGSAGDGTHRDTEHRGCARAWCYRRSARPSWWIGDWWAWRSRRVTGVAPAWHVPRRGGLGSGAVACVNLPTIRRLRRFDGASGKAQSCGRRKLRARAHAAPAVDPGSVVILQGTGRFHRVDGFDGFDGFLRGITAKCTCVSEFYIFLPRARRCSKPSKPSKPTAATSPPGVNASPACWNGTPNAGASLSTHIAGLVRRWQTRFAGGPPALANLGVRR